MASVQIKDSNTDQKILIEFRSIQNSAAVNFNLRLLEKEETIYSKKGSASIQEVNSIANWFEKISNGIPKLTVQSMGISFEFGWLEKGELYFYMNLQTPNKKYQLVDWFQGPDQSKFISSQIKQSISK